LVLVTAIFYVFATGYDNNKLSIEDKMIRQLNRTEYQNSTKDMYVCTYVFIFIVVYTNADAVLHADERACRFTTVVIAIGHNHDFVVGPMMPYYYLI
jgi:hypothetical protein